MNNKQRLLNAIKPLPMTAKDKQEFVDILASGNGSGSSGGEVTTKYFNLPAESEELKLIGDVWLTSAIVSGGKIIAKYRYGEKDQNIEIYASQFALNYTNVKDWLGNKISINFPYTHIVTEQIDVTGSENIVVAGRINTYEDFLTVLSAQIDFSQFEITKEEFYKDVDIKLEDWPKLEVS